MENTIMHYETTTGEKIGLTITFALLYKVKGEYPEAYKRYNDVMMNGMKDIFDATAILYAAYLCANIENTERLPYTQFLEVLGDDMTGVMRTAAALMGRKKKSGFRDPFLKRAGNGEGRHIRPPRFVLEDIEDYYTFYVLILGVPEAIFWHRDLAFVLNVADNKSAYDRWLNAARAKEERKLKSGR